MPHRISKEEATYKLCKVKRCQFGKGGVPFIATHDGRTVRYPDPDIKVGALAMLCLMLPTSCLACTGSALFCLCAWPTSLLNYMLCCRCKA